MYESNFLKENIIKSRQNDKSGRNAMKLVRVSPQNEFLFEKNINQFVELIDFLKNEDDVLVITGYSFCGKSLIGSIIPQIIREKTIYYAFKCTNASTIDDLLLGFFETLKVYAQKKLVHLPKIDTQNFHEKMNIYLTKCENPIVILLDGLNEIKNQKYRDEIMNFISQIVNYENIKLVITTRAFDVSDLKNINLRLETSIIKPLTKDALKDYCLKNIINSDGIEEFYKISRGHYFNLFYTMNYIQPTNTKLKEFVEEVNSSKKSIDEIVITKNLSLLPDSCNNILWISSYSDFGMPMTNLLSVQDCDKEQIDFLAKREIIEIVNERIFVKDYFKTELIKTIEPITRMNIIKGIIKFLEAQLPLKPSLRELKLSRCTIRNEIDRLYVLLKSSQTKVLNKNKTAYMNILGYAKQYKTSWDGFDEIIMPQKEKPETDAQKEKSLEDEAVEVVENLEKQEIQKNENEKEKEALGYAKTLKSKYMYTEALGWYSEALTTAKSNHDIKSVIEILTDIAYCYYKISDYSNAIENYGLVYEIAKNNNFKEKQYATLLEIAKVYTSNYKKDLASNIYREILTVEDIPPSIKYRAELNLFELNFSNMKPKEILSKYLELLEKVKEDNVLSSKIHFRLGFLYDKASSFDNAMKHYKASIASCEDCGKNENLSSCYYNLAEIYNYMKDYNNALEYYQKSFVIDEIFNNLDNILLTTKKIAKIYERKNDKKAQQYYEKALTYARSLNDKYPLACAFIDLGDYYYRKKQDMEALKTYITAAKTLSNQITNENEIAIKDRINDLRVRMGKNVVDTVIRELT